MQTENKIHISLLVPCYNAAAYIEKFIAHLSTLNGRFFEVIFYDDGSIDNTLSILEASGYRYITAGVNKGPGFARNRLSEAAEGEYIHFHDIDDEFNPDFLTLVNQAIQQDRPDVVFGAADWINAESRELIINWQFNEEQLNADKTGYFIINPLGIISVVYKKTAFITAGGFDEEFNCWEDADMHVKLAQNNARFSYIPQVLAYSLRHNKGISSDEDKCGSCRFQFLKRYLTQLCESHKELILNEIWKISIRFYYQGNYKMLRQCITFCEKEGLALPVSGSRFLKLLRTFKIDPVFLYKVQKLSRLFSR